MASQLRLFPLNTVLFPGMQLPLHIFEERYRQMIRECIQAEESFGVVLIRDGHEVGGPATPFDVGTSARIAQVERLEDGRLNLLTTGEARFRILSLIQERPFLLAEVEWLTDSVGDPEETASLQAQVIEKFTECYQIGLATTGQWAARVAVPRTPGDLADFVAARLQLPPHYKQGLLETMSVTERLRQEIVMLEQERKRLNDERTAHYRTKFGRLGALN
jgi:Lon protease-like protein